MAPRSFCSLTLLGFKHATRLGVALFPSTATIVTSLRWRGLGRWIWRPNVTRSCRGRMLISDLQWAPYFFVRQTLRKIEPKQHDAHRIRRRRLKSWVPGCRRMLVAGEGQVFLDKQIRPIFHRSAGLLVAHCKVKNHKVKTWHESWKNMKKHY